MEVVERHIISNDWITVVLLLGLLLMVFSKGLFYNRFSNFMILPFNNKYIFLYSKKGRLINPFHLSMSLFQILNLSLFGYLGALAFYGEERWGTSFVFPAILGGLLAFTLLKIGVQLLGGYVFQSEKLVTSVVFKKLSYLNYSAVVIFGANVLLTYLFPLSKPLVYLGILLLFVVNGIGWISILKIHQKYIASHFFYFILYLCALEIAPFLIISVLIKA